MAKDFKNTHEDICRSKGIRQTDIAVSLCCSQGRISKLQKGEGSHVFGCQVIRATAALAGGNNINLENAIIGELVRSASGRNSEDDREHPMPPAIESLTYDEAKREAIRLSDAGDHDSDIHYIRRMKIAAPDKGRRAHACILEAIRSSDLGLKDLALAELNVVRETLDVPEEGDFDAMALINLGEIYLDTGNLRRARECTEQALKTAIDFLGYAGALDPKRAVHVIGYSERLQGLISMEHSDFVASERHFAKSAQFHAQDKVRIGTRDYTKLAKPDLALRDEAYRVLLLGLTGRRDEAIQLAAELKKRASYKSPAAKFYVDLHLAVVADNDQGVAKARLFATTNNLSGLLQHADRVDQLAQRTPSRAAVRARTRGVVRRVAIALLTALLLQTLTSIEFKFPTSNSGFVRVATAGCSGE